MTDNDMNTRVHEVERAVVESAKIGIQGIPELPLTDTILYIGMKYLYIALRNGLATREELSDEKKRLIASYKIAAHDQELYDVMAKRRNKLASKLSELERCGCEHCQELVRLFDGRTIC